MENENEVERLRAELARAEARASKAESELRRAEEARAERVRAARLRANLASIGDADLVRIAAAAAESLEDERLGNRVREFARLAFTPTEAKTPEGIEARRVALGSLREKIVASLAASDPTAATLAALWGAKLRK